MADGAFTVANYQSIGSTPITAPPFTVSCWVYALDTSSGTVFALTDTGSDTKYFLCYSAVGAEMRFYARHDAVSKYAARAYSKLTWVHAAFVSSASNHRVVYVNGSAGTAETTDVVPAGIDSMSLGVKLVNSGPALPFNGYVADLAVYSEALDQAAITLLANGLEPVGVRRCALGAAWPLNEADGNALDNLNTYDLTESGTVPRQTHPTIERIRSRVALGVRR